MGKTYTNIWIPFQQKEPYKKQVGVRRSHPESFLKALGNSNEKPFFIPVIQQICKKKPHMKFLHENGSKNLNPTPELKRLHQRTNSGLEDGTRSVSWNLRQIEQETNYLISNKMCEKNSWMHCREVGEVTFATVKIHQKCSRNWLYSNIHVVCVNFDLEREKVQEEGCDVQKTILSTPHMSAPVPLRTAGKEGHHRTSPRHDIEALGWWPWYSSGLPRWRRQRRHAGCACDCTALPWCTHGTLEPSPWDTRLLQETWMSFSVLSPRRWRMGHPGLGRMLGTACLRISCTLLSRDWHRPVCLNIDHTLDCGEDTSCYFHLRHDDKGLPLSHCKWRSMKTDMKCVPIECTQGLERRKTMTADDNDDAL